MAVSIAVGLGERGGGEGLTDALSILLARTEEGSAQQC